MITSFTVEDTPCLLVELEAGRVWELTTENGTRHLVDRRDAKIWRLRIPGSGRAMAWADGYWDSSALSVRPVDYAQFRDTGALRPPREGAPTCEVELGASAFFAGDGKNEWYLTTFVVAVRSLEPGEMEALESQQ